MADSVARLLADATAVLQPVAGSLASMEARILLAHVLGCTQEALISAPEHVLTDAQKKQWMMLLGRRAAHTPVAYLIGKKEFFGLEFEVNPATLIPRPDSETIVHAVLESMVKPAQPCDILDLGTGSGCLLLSLLHECPQARGLGVDRSEAALQVAQRNAQQLGLANRAGFMLGNWAEAIQGRFEVIVSNPPYISASEWRDLSRDVAEFEPESALLGGLDGLDCYRKILPQLAPRLTPTGVAVLEIGWSQAQALADMAQLHALRVEKIHQDLAGNPRAVVLKRILHIN